MMRGFVFTLLAGFIGIVCALSFSLITCAAEFMADSIQKQHGMDLKG
jgi:hypothetical protein